ncbi:MAG: tetratricopeptide repeat protein [Bacteroidia bacterium]|nr:tetratricopeptide repeat protein [Bacteroidia bacterium]MDW8015792.1 tetratricopeptide repeat protein [Bacteroidia bacterium]
MERLALWVSLCWAQALPPLWGPESFRTQAEPAHFHGAQSWARQQDLLYQHRLPLPLPLSPPPPLVPLWEKYALFDLLRASTSYELAQFSQATHPSYRSLLARFYAAKYAFLKREYEAVLSHLSELRPEEMPRPIRQEMEFMEGYAAYAMGDKVKAIQRLRPLSEKVGPFHDAANYYLGLIYYERGDWRAAVSHLEAVQTQALYAQAAPLWLAYALAQIPDITRLVEWGERWLTQMPPPAYADTLWAFLAITLMQVQQCEKADLFAKRVPENALVRLHQGICAYRQGKDTLALRLWEPLLTGKDSIASWARYGSASALYRLGRKEEALSMLREIAPSPTAPAPQALWLTAQIAWDLRLIESGKNALLLYLRLPNPPKLQEALRYLAEFYAIERKYTEAIHTLDTIKVGSFIEPIQRFWLMGGIEFFAEKRYAAAESLFARGCSLEGPHTPLLLFWRGEAIYRQGDLERAIEAYRAFLRHPQHRATPYREEAHLAIAWSFLQLKRPDEALQHSEPLRKGGNTSLRPLAAFVSAGSYFLKKRYSEALNLYTELLKSNLSPVQVRYHLAQTLMRLERYKEAEAVLLEVPPTLAGADAVLYLRAEICALWLNQPACTKEAVETLLRYFPTSSKAPLAKARLGLAQAELGEKEEAIATLQQVLGEYPSFPEAARLALEGLRALLPAPSYDSTYKAFLRRLPSESETRLSFERERLRQLAEAERWTILSEEAIALALRFPSLAGEALAWRAWAAENLKDTLRALSYYEELLHYPEQRSRAWERLARLHASRGALPAALAAQDSFLQYLPKGGYLRLQGLLLWADIATAIGKGDTALKVLTGFLQDTLLNEFSRQRLLLGIAGLQEKMGYLDSALQYLSQAAAVQKNLLTAEALSQQARLLYTLKRYGEARAAIYRLRDELPQYIEPRARAYLILARILIDENKKKSARQLLESLIENAPEEEIRQEARALRDSLTAEPPPPPVPKKKKP